MAREGLASSRSEARALILAGRVLVDGVRHTKAGTAVAAEAQIRVRGPRRAFVSRGGDKLAGALDAFGVRVAGLTCLDIGASTGGFTDCLLRRGARSVVAVDVGYGQLDARLRADPRVRVRERTNVRHVEAADVGARIDLITADVSFISLRLVLPALRRVAPAAQAVVLVKPQFEVGRDQVGKGGVVRDDALRRAAADSVAHRAEELGWREVGRVDSVLPGPKGNREVFLHLVPRSTEKSGFEGP